MRVIILLALFFIVGCDVATNDIPVTETYKGPMLGWNSYDSYGNEITFDEALDNLYFFEKYLMPVGYEYFCIDAGWDDVHKNVTFDEYGRQVSSPVFFPDGIEALIDSVHAKGGKFGLWMARGMNKNAYNQNCKIKGTDYHLQDIADIVDTSDWWPHNYGVDMSKPGAQEYYDSIFELLASWGVDFVKYDDIVPHPDEIAAVKKAIEKCGRDIVLSLSPGDDASIENIEAYKLADMVRITSDVWDRKSDIDKGFTRWEIMQEFANLGFYLDLDMIPFGRINRKSYINEGYSRKNYRMDEFSVPQKKTFMTQRALAASPLIMGGALNETDLTSIELITNTEMLRCNQESSCGKLIHRDSTDSIDVWKSSSLYNKTSWVGVFNRSNSEKAISLTDEDLALEKSKALKYFDIWGDTLLNKAFMGNLSLEADGVLFVRVSE